MWKTTLAALLTLAISGASLHAKSRHNNNAEAAIGGLITGVFLADMLDSDTSVSVEFASRRGDRYDRGDRHERRDGWKHYDNSYRNYDRRHDRRWDDRRDSGYYTYKTQKIWVPGHWTYRHDRYGRTVKVWIKGHHERRKIKIWVSTRKGGCYRS